jgi:hypothetical protein
VVTLPGIHEIDRTITYEDDEISLKQVLSCLRTSKSWKTPIFTQINFSNTESNYIGICHNGEKKEARLIAENLIPLCLARFGDNASEWFEHQAIQLADDVTFDHEKKKLVDNSICEYLDLIKTGRRDLSDAELQAMEDDGEYYFDEEMMDEGSDMSDERSESELYDFEKEDEENFEKEYIFDLELLFNLEPPYHREGPHQENSTYATFATGASKASRLHQEYIAEQQTGGDNDD